MSRPQSNVVVLVVLTGFSIGCASFPKDAGFHDVQDTIRQRSGFMAHWDQQPASEESVTERIRAFLREELNERSAIEIALLNNHRLQATFEELGIASADLVEAGLVRNPLLSAEIRFPSRPFEFSLTQSILDLITLHRRRETAAATFEVVKLRVANEVLDLIAQIRSAFYTLQAADQVKAMRQAIVDASRVSAELAIRQHEAGNISDLDLENEQAMLEQAKLDLARSEGEVLAEREHLNSLMGLWGLDTEWKLAPKLPDLPETELDVTGVESLAVSQRLDLAEARQEVEVAARALPLARARAIGDVSAGVHSEREPEGTRTRGPSLEVPVPLFNRGKAARARAEATLRQAQQRYAALAVEVRAEARAARNRVLLARNRVEYYRDVMLPRRERIVAFSQRHYNFMLLGTFQLLVGTQNEITARRECIEALRDYWIATSDLALALGGSLPPGEVETPISGTADEPSDNPSSARHRHEGGLEQ